MIWQVARVLDREAGRLTLEFSAPEACERCANGNGCGAGVFSRLFSRRATRVELPSDLSVVTGNWVRVGLPPSALAVAAAWHYGAPLLGFLGAAATAHAVWADAPARDPIALAAGLTGFLVISALVPRRSPGALNAVVERLSCAPSGSNLNLP